MRHVLALKVNNSINFNKLCTNICKNGGRNNSGSIVVRHRGGRGRLQKPLLTYGNLIYMAGQIIKVTRPKDTSACAMLVKYKNGLIAYNLLACNLDIGDQINIKLRGQHGPGSLLPLSACKVGQLIYSITSRVGRPTQYIRAGGTAGQISAIKSTAVIVKLPSGKLKKFDSRAWAYTGRVGTNIWKFTQFGSAGRARRRGWRPQTRGTAMNAVDHPHGGNSGPSRSSVSPWGWSTK